MLTSGAMQNPLASARVAVATSLRHLVIGITIGGRFGNIAIVVGHHIAGTDDLACLSINRVFPR